jgi:hypothetical protein
MQPKCPEGECPYAGVIYESASQIKMLLPIVERIEGKLDFMRVEQASEKGRTEAVKEELNTFRDRARGQAKTIREDLLEAEARASHSEGGVSKGFIAGVMAVGILVGTSVVSVAKALGFLRLFGG